MKIILPPIINEINRLFYLANDEFLIISPWIRSQAIQHVINLKDCQKIKFRILTVADNFLSGTSDIDAVDLLLQMKADIRILEKLHAKIYVADKRIAIITSANFTKSGLIDNIEIGAYINENNIAPLIKKTDEWFELGKPVSKNWLDSMKKKIREKQADLKELKQWEQEICKISDNLRGNTIALPEPEMPFCASLESFRKSKISKINRGYSASEYLSHYNIAKKVYENLNTTLKGLANKPQLKEKPVINENNLWFDFQSHRDENPHLVIWFLYNPKIGRYVEVAINSENKPSNKKIKRKTKLREFWQILSNLEDIEIRVYRKNVKIDKRGRLYGIRSDYYEWGKTPIFKADDQEISQREDSVRESISKHLGSFDADNYRANSTLKGSPSCNTAIFAFNVAKRFDYNLENWKTFINGFNELTELYKFLCD